MTKKEQLIISLGALTVGLLLCWFAWTTTLAQPVYIISIIGGLAFSVAGFISLILAWKRPGKN
jgi:hypothetical protein